MLIVEDFLATGKVLWSIILWVVGVFFGFDISGTICARVKRYLINENIYVRRKFKWLIRATLVVPISFSAVSLHIFGFDSLSIFGFEGLAYWLGLLPVVSLSLGLFYYPEPVIGLANVTSALLDRVGALRRKIGMVLNG